MKYYSPKFTKKRASSNKDGVTGVGPDGLYELYANQDAIETYQQQIEDLIEKEIAEEVERQKDLYKDEELSDKELLASAMI